MTRALRIIARLWQLLYWLHLYVWRFLFNAMALFSSLNRVSEIEDEILLQSAVSLSRKIRDKELTSEQLVQSCIKMCRNVNGLINAIVEENFQDALTEARNIDRSVQDNSAPSADEVPFLGVPFAVKDHMFVNGMLCTAGIPNRRDIRMFQDAEAVAFMKKAGAIVLCMTNVSEACMWYESYNTIYGRTCNPYDTRRGAGGSSGGLGALIGSGSVPFGIGTDIGGSIRIPAFFNGIFGHKPTQKGVYPTAKGRQKDLYCVGPMCRYAEGFIPMLKVLGRPEMISKLELDVEVDLSKLRIFYMTGLDTLTASPVDSRLKGAIHQVCKNFAEKYDVLSYKLDLEDMPWSLAIWLMDMNVSWAPTFAQEMSNLKGEVIPSVELLKLIFCMSQHTYPALSLAFMERILKKMGSEEDIIRAGSLPLGIQIVGASGKDRVTLAVARELERAFGGWMQPTQTLEHSESSESDFSLPS